MQPLVLGLGVGIGIGGGSRLDADAQAYITAIEGDGVTVTGAQKTALSDFVVAQKASGAWAVLSRMYLPTWGVAAANARCLVSATSGTFNGSVTHGTGYIARADSTGYFDTGIQVDEVSGLTNDSAWIGALMKTAVANDQYLGAVSGANLFLLRHTVAPSITCEILSYSGGRFTTGTTSGNAGIISGRRLSGTRANNQRLAAGRSVLGSSTDSAVGTAIALNIYALQRNNNGTASAGVGSHMGAMWFGSGVSDALDSSFTADLETLWETVTGLSIP